jgi:hypothetical protein
MPSGSNRRVVTMRDVDMLFSKLVHPSDIATSEAKHTDDPSNAATGKDRLLHLYGQLCEWLEDMNTEGLIFQDFRALIDAINDKVHICI